ncbi:MAG: enoyl-CoA hydratase/isomerase family protein [Alphaproteobacteria bacterium]
MDYSRYEAIAVTRKGRVLTLTMNRPDTLNAIDNQLHDELSRIFYDVAEDRETDIVVLTGAGKAFSAGGDMEALQSWIDEPVRFEQVIFEAKKIIFGILDLEKPVIARVNGPAVGLGCTLALFADIVIAAESARIGDPHVAIGFVAGDGGAVIMPQLVGFARAKELLFTGDIISAARAAEIGLINYVVPDAELDDRVNAMVERLTNLPTKAMGWTKISVNIPLKRLAHSMMDLSLSLESQSNRTKDHQEAIAAFREKRKPRFTGE